MGDMMARRRMKGKPMKGKTMNLGALGRANTGMCNVGMNSYAWCKKSVLTKDKAKWKLY